MQVNRFCTGLAHLLQAAREADEDPNFAADLELDTPPVSTSTRKKRKAPSPRSKRARHSSDESVDDEDGQEGGYVESDEYTDDSEEFVYQPPRNKRPRNVDDIENRSSTSTSSNGSTEDENEIVMPPEFTLPPSKNPCLDALAFCVVMGYGAEQTEEDVRNSTISIYDCRKLLAYIKTFCPKQTQTNNDEYRVKALKRWFSDMPTKKMRTTGNSFIIKMKADRRRVIQRVIRRMQSYVKSLKLE